jgi:hypothetical protein
VYFSFLSNYGFTAPASNQVESSAQHLQSSARNRRSFCQRRAGRARLARQIDKGRGKEFEKSLLGMTTWPNVTYAELDGYDRYAEPVRCRLVPGVW